MNATKERFSNLSYTDATEVAVKLVGALIKLNPQHDADALLDAITMRLWYDRLPEFEDVA